MQVNIKKVTKLILGKKYHAASALLSELVNPLQILIDEADMSTPFTGVKWNLIDKSRSEIIFSRSIPGDRCQFFVTRLVLLLPLIQSFHASDYFQHGSTYINLDDSADALGLAFCSNRDDSILIPDIDFLNSRGYEESRLSFLRDPPEWKDRLPVVFWRGSTTGVRVGETWHGLPRLNLCQLVNNSEDQTLFDVGVSSLVQVSKTEEKEILAKRYIRNFAPITSSNQYKYQIDIDGNTNAWAALFQKLLSGSAVLKVASPHQFRQWYYSDLIPWVNFVPVQSDMSDLLEKVQWLLENDDKAKEIATNGMKLAYSLTYENELGGAHQSIKSALG